MATIGTILFWVLLVIRVYSSATSLRNNVTAADIHGSTDFPSHLSVPMISTTKLSNYPGRVSNASLAYRATVGVPSAGSQRFRTSSKYSTLSHVATLLLLICGDIETNPGPKVPCPCGLLVQSRHRGLCCDRCDQWFHARCVAVSSEIYMELSESVDDWFCTSCSVEHTRQATVMQKRHTLARRVSKRTAIEKSRDVPKPKKCIHVGPVAIL